MSIHHERRSGEDRRKTDQQLGSGPERRRFPIERRSALSRVIHDIASSFGVRPESLAVTGKDDLLGHVESCPECEKKERRCAELEAALAQSRSETEQYRLQLEDILKSRTGDGR